MQHLLRTIKIPLLVLGFFILSVPLWLKVDTLPLRLWDESRNAVNAIEMYETGEFITRTYKNEPETYNLKPPLLTWLQSLTMRVFGLNELSIRLPSVVASVLSLILVFCFVFISTKSIVFSFFSSGILATSSGFYGEHVGRFGDHDALVTFYCLLFVFFAFLYVRNKKPLYVYCLFFCLVFGVLTKSITILMFAPAVLLYFIYSKSVLSILKSKHFYIATIGAIMVIVGYYLLRESRQPGYLSLVWNDELFPRYLNTSKNLNYQDSDAFYYVNHLTKNLFSYWVLLVPLAAIPLFLKKCRSQGLVLSFLAFATFLVVISNGTSNFWYLAPVLPLLSVFIGIGLFSFVNLTKLKPTIISIILVGALIYPYKAAYSWAFNPVEESYNWETYGISYCLKNNDLSQNLTSNTSILLDSIYGFEPHLFYVKKLKHEKGVDIERKRMYHVKSGDTLLITHHSTYNWLQQNYSVEVIDSLNQYTKRLVVTSK